SPITAGPRRPPPSRPPSPTLSSTERASGGGYLSPREAELLVGGPERCADQRAGPERPGPAGRERNSSVAAVTNRLGDETSPYLHQHRDNPVDWYPWGDEAFEQAREDSKPIFLSVGYSSCHWCHVMAHESFEDP